MQRPQKSPLFFLTTYFAPRWRQALLLAVLLFIGIGLQLLNPQLLSRFIDTAQAGGALAKLTTVAALYTGVALVTQLVAVVETYVAESLAWTATNQLRRDLARHCLGLDLSFHSTRTPGELIERVDGDVTALANFFSRFVVALVGSGLLLLGALVLLYRIDRWLGLAFSLFALALLGVMTVLRTLAEPYWKAMRQADAVFFGFLGELLMATEDIRANGAVAFLIRRVTERMRAWLANQQQAFMRGSAIGMAGIAGFAIGNALAFAFSAYLWRTGAATLGTVYLIFQYTELLRRPIEQIQRQLQDLQLAAAGAIRIEELMRIEPRVQDGRGIAIPDGPLAVEFADVSFGYGEQAAVLHQFSLTVKAGTVLGLLGRTGSGKTTISRLVLRLYDPDSGTVRLGGVTLRDARIADIRARIGMVTQEVQLLHASVRDNLTFYDPTISDDRVLQSLRDLGLGPWYTALSDGLDTEIEPGRSGLSAGEAQLLVLSRVFLRNPGLVIMDEASSRVDPATERLIQHATDALLRGRTGIIIAHRLATVDRVDEIAILDAGRVVEHGSRASLAADATSDYAALRRAGMEVART